MAKIIDAETKKRHQVADRMIDLCADLLDNPEIQGATNGLAKEARSLLDLLYVPNKRDGYYVASGKKYEGQGIPLVVAAPGERTKIKRLAKYALHPLQEERLQGALADHGIDTSDIEYAKILDRIRKTYNEYEGPYFGGPDDDGSWIACVYSPGSNIRLQSNNHQSKPKHYTVETNPVVFMQANLPELDDSGDLVFHELVHVQQALTRVIYRTKDMKKICQRDELEAYSYEAIAQSIHYGQSIEENPVKWRAMDIEAVRRRVNANSTDPFEITTELVAAIKKAGRWPL